MNAWLVDLVKDANERLFTEGEVERIIAFADTVPARVKLGEDLERWEPELVSAVVGELAGTPAGGESAYAAAAVRDVVESLRHLFVSAFRDQPEFLAHRWTDNLAESLRRSGIDADWAPAVYRAVDARLSKQLRGPSLELYRQAMDGLLETLHAPAARTRTLPCS